MGVYAGPDMAGAEGLVLSERGNRKGPIWRVCNVRDLLGNLFWGGVYEGVWESVPIQLAVLMLMH